MPSFKIWIRLCLLLPLSLTLSLVLLAPVSAQDQAKSRETAAQQALAQHGSAGKVLSVREKINKQGRQYFEVQVISNGNVSIYRINRR